MIDYPFTGELHKLISVKLWQNKIIGLRIHKRKIVFLLTEFTFENKNCSWIFSEHLIAIFRGMKMAVRCSPKIWEQFLLSNLDSVSKKTIFLSVKLLLIKYLNFYYTKITWPWRGFVLASACLQPVGFSLCGNLSGSNPESQCCDPVTWQSSRLYLTACDTAPGRLEFKVHHKCDRVVLRSRFASNIWNLL